MKQIVGVDLKFGVRFYVLLSFIQFKVLVHHYLAISQASLWVFYEPHFMKAHQASPCR